MASKKRTQSGNAGSPHEGEANRFTDAEQRRFNDNVAWLIEACPELFENVRIENLRPDLYPEHAVIAEWLRARGRIKRLASGGPADDAPPGEPRRPAGGGSR
jgi:hypothetical protein